MPALTKRLTSFQSGCRPSLSEKHLEHGGSEGLSTGFPKSPKRLLLLCFGTQIGLEGYTRGLEV